MRLSIDESWDGSPAAERERVALELTHGHDGWSIDVFAPLHGDPAPELPPGSCPRLWTYEAVECFLVGSDDRYLEIEMGPHGHYLLLELRGPRNIVRQGMRAEYSARLEPGGRWRGRLVLPAGLVPDPVLRVNAFALHGQGAARRYLCFRALPGERPDFHQIARFPLLSALTDAGAGARAPGD